jgi:hypothetical protein
MTTKNTSVELQCFQTLLWKYLSISFYCFSFMGLPDTCTMATECILWKKIISKAWEKIHLTVYLGNKYACAKSIFIDCNLAITSRFDFQPHTPVCVVSNYKTQKERFHVKILLHHPCRLWSPLSSSSKTLSKHMYTVLLQCMFRFCFHSIREAVEFARLRTERFWNCRTERT